MLPSGHLLPPLRIVEASGVRLHEDVDPRRAGALAERLVQEGILRNPPIAAALPGGGFVVLDGANRTAALRTIGVPYHLLQIVDYAAPEIRLEVWHHLLREDGTVQAALPREQVLTLKDRAELEQRLRHGDVACGLVTETAVLGVAGAKDLHGRIATLRRVVATYAGRLNIYRVAVTDLDALRAEYDQVGAIVVFPRFSKDDILALADLPDKLPTGITRHIIPSRVLRINLPIDLLRNPGAVEQKNAALRDLIHARLIAHRVRHYRESTILFDE